MFSTIKRYSYRFEGGAYALAKARAAIEALKARHADCDGDGQNYFGDEPEMLDGGVMTWSCKSQANLKDFQEAILEITDSNDLLCFAYWGTTDGQHFSSLDLWDIGEESSISWWPADIGIDAAMAIDVLSNSDSVEALLVLFDSFHSAFDDGWNEVDFPRLSKAGIIGATITMVVVSHPHLMEEAKVREALVAMKRPLMVVRRDLKKLMGVDESDLEQNVDRLMSAIEAMELDDAAPASLTVKASKSSLAKAL